ncbi:MAG: type II secretion system protein [Firmicutes bacterium]|nr:type II secretion system protein [Bacillota bacterium]MBQ9604658.1 type II secretion system protein [Bacillota bacterium]
MFMQRFGKLRHDSNGFSLVELIVVIAIMVILIAALVPNLVKYLKNAESISAKNTAATVYRAAETYVVSMTAEGVDFPGNTTLEPPSILWTPPIDLMDEPKNAAVLEIMLNDAGNAVEYVYFESPNGINADYPAGFSPHQIND